MQTFRRNKREPAASQQLLAKWSHVYLPITVHLGSAKAHYLGTRDGDCCEKFTSKLKGTRAQEGTDWGGSVQNQSKTIGYVLVKHKLPPHPVGKIAHISDTLIGQVRQPPSIGGSQVSDTPLVIGYQ